MATFFGLSSTKMHSPASSPLRARNCSKITGSGLTSRSWAETTQSRNRTARKGKRSRHSAHFSAEMLVMA